MSETTFLNPGFALERVKILGAMVPDCSLHSLVTGLGRGTPGVQTHGVALGCPSLSKMADMSHALKPPSAESSGVCWRGPCPGPFLLSYTSLLGPHLGHRKWGLSSLEWGQCVFGGRWQQDASSVFFWPLDQREGMSANLKHLHHCLLLPTDVSTPGCPAGCCWIMLLSLHCNLLNLLSMK